jgi:hypothetical protein
MPTKLKLVAGFAMVFAFMLGVAWAKDQAEKAHSKYINGEYGFTLTPPDFNAAGGAAVQTVRFDAPAQKGFSASVVVTVQPGKTQRQAIARKVFKAFETMGLKLNSKTDLQVSGHDAMVIDYEGKIGTEDVHCLGLFVIDDERVVQVTGTALQGDFAAKEAAFRRCIDSFKLE